MRIETESRGATPRGYSGALDCPDAEPAFNGAVSPTNLTGLTRKALGTRRVYHATRASVE